MAIKRMVTHNQICCSQFFYALQGVVFYAKQSVLVIETLENWDVLGDKARLDVAGPVPITDKDIKNDKRSSIIRILRCSLFELWRR